MKNLYKIWLCSAKYTLHQALNTYDYVPNI